MAKIAVMITITTHSGRRAELRRLWEEHLGARVLDNAAQELYLVVEDAASPDVLHLVEMYADEAEMATNAEAPWFAAYLHAVQPLLAGPPHMATGRPVWAKGYVL